MPAWMLTDFLWWLSFCAACCLAFALILHVDERQHDGFYDQERER